MRRMLSNLAAGALLAICCHAAGAQDLFSDKKPAAFDFLQKIDADQTVGSYPVLNLGKNWGLFHAKTSTTNLNQSLGHISAVDIRDGKFVAFLDMTGNLELVRSGDWTDEPCKRTDFLYKKGEGFKNINCATIGYTTSFFQRPTGDFQVYYGKFREMKLDIPPTVIRIDFTRYSDQGRRLVYSIKLNPEFFGFARDTETVWGASSWNKAFIEKDPKKVAFIAGLSKWVDAVRDRMDKAFDHQKDAFDGLPSLDSLANAAVDRQ